MMKVIELSHMIGGTTIFWDGYKRTKHPCKDIPTQVQDILNANKHYKYVSIAYKPPTKVINMEYATMIVDDAVGDYEDGKTAIQNLFKIKDKISLNKAGKFQDEVGQWFVDAINEKLEREK